ncbi:lipase family alpha/beta hydrolase [Rhodococcus coprophilus]|uniref:Lipase n=2 Tax=Rhodococcus coprophilus TaxID=38310 RepID=A0A2X4WZK1_9NOCA|nr:alpha/beta fold hydrolase [Rhodococcus coprophilus]MBM7458394.1 triacylglycerol lipase [Rhodococcus coprophilus]SQI32465.1 lipase [Rhodococcus coprophilus]
MLRRIMATVMGTVIVAAGAVTGGGIAQAEDTATKQYPLAPTFLDGIGMELANPGGSAPGSNDWSCEPSDEHPEPVVLVHGTMANRQDNWAYLSPLLANEGYCVFALTYGNYPELPWPFSAVGGLKPMEQSAVELAAFVDRVLDVTGAEKVSLVGHSQGTLMPTYYLNRLGGSTEVRNLISLAPLWDGSHAFLLEATFSLFGQAGLRDELEQLVATVGCGACPQVLAGSQWFRDLHADGVYAPGVQYTNIISRYDELVLPHTSGYREADNATNFVLQDHCEADWAEHVAIVNDPVAAAVVLNALDPDNPRPVPCVSVPPFTGWSPTAPPR